MTDHPVLQGAGIALRGPHLPELLSRPPVAPWLELLADQYLGLNPGLLAPVERLRAEYPMALHCVGMSVAGLDPLDAGYLAAVRDLADRLEIGEISDHLCWTGMDGAHGHDLFPVPLAPGALDHVAARVHRIQETLGRNILLENISAYVAFRSDCLAEADFIAELVRRTGCGVLLDLNNLYVNQCNLERDARLALSRMPMDAIGYVHLGGHRDSGQTVVDTHDAPVSVPVWELLEHLARLRPGVPVLIEWDHQLPALDVLLRERARAATMIIGRQTERAA